MPDPFARIGRQLLVAADGEGFDNQDFCLPYDAGFD